MNFISKFFTSLAGPISAAASVRYKVLSTIILASALLLFVASMQLVPCFVLSDTVQDYGQCADDTFDRNADLVIDAKG